MKYEVTKSRSAKNAFTFVELLIVVAILGIMAAIVVPMFQEHSLRAKEATVRDNLRILREAIGRYAADHADIAPGYPWNDTSMDPTYIIFGKHLVFEQHYLSELPENLFNGKKAVLMIKDNQDFPLEPTTFSGWIYKAKTKEIRIDWPGTDSDGTNYFDY